MFLFREFVLDINKELRASLQKIFGVGWYKSFLVASKVGLSFPFYLANINGYNFSILFFLLKGLVVSEVRIKRQIESNISNKIELNSYEGVRHKLYLPVRGQRTRTNARTQRSRRNRIRNFNIKNS